MCIRVKFCLLGATMQTKDPILLSEDGAFCRCTLFRHDGFGGAVGSAGAAVHTGVGVNDVLGLALRNRLNGAVLGAGAAADAGIGDLMSHESLPP